VISSEQTGPYRQIQILIIEDPRSQSGDRKAGRVRLSILSALRLETIAATLSTSPVKPLLDWSCSSALSFPKQDSRTSVDPGRCSPNLAFADSALTNASLLDHVMPSRPCFEGVATFLQPAQLFPHPGRCHPPALPTETDRPPMPASSDPIPPTRSSS
jgi:hypothetical protein